MFSLCIAALLDFIWRYPYCIHQGRFALGGSIAEKLCSVVVLCWRIGKLCPSHWHWSAKLCYLKTITWGPFGKTGITFRSVLRFGSIFYSRKVTKFCTWDKIALPFGADLRNSKKIHKHWVFRVRSCFQIFRKRSWFCVGHISPLFKVNFFCSSISCDPCWEKNIKKIVDKIRNLHSY